MEKMMENQAGNMSLEAFVFIFVIVIIYDYEV